MHSYLDGLEGELCPEVGHKRLKKKPLRNKSIILGSPLTQGNSVLTENIIKICKNYYFSRSKILSENYYISEIILKPATPCGSSLKMNSKGARDKGP